MIDLFKVHMPPGIDERMSATLSSGYVTEGPRVKEFEERMADYLGNPHVAAVNSCTSGLTLALLAAGPQHPGHLPGRQVLGLHKHVPFAVIHGVRP